MGVCAWIGSANNSRKHYMGEMKILMLQVVLLVGLCQVTCEYANIVCHQCGNDWYLWDSDCDGSLGHARTCGTTSGYIVCLKIEDLITGNVKRSCGTNTDPTVASMPPNYCKRTEYDMYYDKMTKSYIKTYVNFCTCDTDNCNNAERTNGRISALMLTLLL